MSACIVRALVLLLPWSAPLAQLDLPESVGGSRPESAPAEAETDGGAEPAPMPAMTPLESGPAAHVVGELMRVSDPKDIAVDGAVVTLLGMGESGVDAARGMLLHPHAPVIVAGARTLLGRNSPGGLEAILTRLRTERAGRIVVPLFEVVLEEAGDELSSSDLLQLLDHAHGSVRSSASRALAPRMDASLMPTLREHLVARLSGHGTRRHD